MVDRRLSAAEIEAIEQSLLRQIEADLTGRLAGDGALDRLRMAGSRAVRKRNYNLDHLARMNFRRSDRASNSRFNSRHMLGGL